jgi:hypothetical protein
MNRCLYMHAHKKIHAYIRIYIMLKIAMMQVYEYVYRKLTLRSIMI